VEAGGVHDDVDGVAHAVVGHDAVVVMRVILSVTAWSFWLSTACYRWPRTGFALPTAGISG